MRAIKALWHGRKISSADRRALRGLSGIELADIACELNRWGWPAILPNPEPPVHVKDGRRGRIMRYIEAIVGPKLINRRHNKERMTDEEHERWWNSEGRNLLIRDIRQKSRKHLRN